MTFIIEELGVLVYSFPAALFVFFLRETFRNYIFTRLFSEESAFSLFYIDIFSLFSTAYYGVGWGGLVNQHRKDNIITFVLSQLFFVILVIFAVTYFHLNKPVPGSYTFEFVVYLVKYCWVLFYINLIPLPPFDASFFYMQRITSPFAFTLIAYTMKFIVIFIIIFDVMALDFLKADSFLEAVGINS